MRKHCLLTLNGFKKSRYNKYLNALKERHIKQQRSIKRVVCVTIDHALLIMENIKPRQCVRKSV